MSAALISYRRNGSFFGDFLLFMSKYPKQSITSNTEDLSGQVHSLRSLRSWTDMKTHIDVLRFNELSHVLSLLPHHQS